MKAIKLFIFTSLILLGFNSYSGAQPPPGNISGQIFDSLRNVIAGAVVTIIDASGKEKAVITSGQGEFSFPGLAPGKYTIRAKAPGFSAYRRDSVELNAGKRETLLIELSIEETVTNVEVKNDESVDRDPANNASQTVLTGKAIDDLPDDPTELQNYLEALAGPGAGPDGPSMMVDGFSNAGIPAKESIREIRLNQNPFSAEYDRSGFGRIEILTRPGTDKFGGSASFTFNNERLNSRNPFSDNRAPTQTRNFGGSFSGPLNKREKSSFYFDGRSDRSDNGTVVNAIVLDQLNKTVAFNRDLIVPFRRFQINPRINFAPGDRFAVQIRYEYTSLRAENQGVGGFSLLSRAFTSASREHEIRVSESMVINPNTINETRFQLIDNRSRQEGDDSLPVIRVANAFTGGGSPTGESSNVTRRWEFQNYTLVSSGQNSRNLVKFGMRARGAAISDRSETGYGGSFTFTGVTDPATGQVLYSSIEQYRQKVAGNPDQRFDPNQFSITTGNPEARVSQIDLGLFIADDWKARDNLTVSLGLRYEYQTNLRDRLNFAPRLALAWQPQNSGGSAKLSKTVLRAGFGIFYERFNENNTLTALRNDGLSQLRYTVTGNPAILGQAVFTPNEVTNIPTPRQIAGSAPLTSIPYKIDRKLLRSPYSLQGVVNVERQLPFKTTVAATLIVSRGLHLLRLRNTNAPLCPPLTPCPGSIAEIQLLRPDKLQGSVYEFESGGFSNTRQLIVNFNSRFNNKFNLFGNYTVSSANADTDGVSSGSPGQFNENMPGFPAYSYDLSGEYAPSAFIPRHAVFVSGAIEMPWGLRATPTISFSSGRRYNITSGVDTNRDSIFSERPTYAELNAVCRARQLVDSFCGIGRIASPETTIIPRNFGTAPENFTINLNLNKTFRIGKTKMMIGANIKNLLNSVNRGLPPGALTSPFFAGSISTSGLGATVMGGGSANRRVDILMRFNW